MSLNNNCKKKIVIVSILVFLSFLLVGCAQEEVPKHIEDFIACGEDPSRLMKYPNQCVIDNIVYTPEQIINISSCSMYYNGCSSCEIIEARLLSISCEPKICVEYKEPKCIQ